MQAEHFKVRTSKIKAVFISHLHGDHYLGLVGLLSTMHLQRREKEIHLYGPAGLDEIITLQFKYSDTRLNYKLLFHETDTQNFTQLYEDECVTVHSIPLEHRIPCCGFLFREKEKPIGLQKEKLPKDITIEEILQLKRGEDVNDLLGNVRIAFSDVAAPPLKRRSYAYCSDTAYSERIIPYIQSVDLLYHEATFAEQDAPRAQETNHSTATQAATIALKAGADRLLIGHFSSRYKHFGTLADEAKTVFKNTELSHEGKVINIPLV